ncbi:MAG TPA: BrnT family toxin [Acidisphaera sp.]|nr:BrnT family toxin [Acidisphaera sp.]
MTRFTWDPRKNAINARRHGIAFEDAKRIFDGPTVEREDDGFDYGESRVYAVGLVNGVEITVIYTDRDNGDRHLISAWRAEPHERRYFWAHVED